MNKSTIATILGTAALGLMRKNSGSKAPLLGLEDVYTLDGIDEVREYANKSIEIRDRVSEVDLTEAGLTSFPMEVFKFKNLSDLDLRWNHISSIPPEIGDLIYLRSLNIVHNNIDSIPPEIGNLKNLKGLYLSNNNISKIPTEIGYLGNLIRFDIGDNNLSSLPPEIGNLKSLKWFSFPRNSISKLPKEIADLYFLGQQIYFAGNGFNMPDNETLQYWMKNMKPTLFERIMDHVEPSSELRRF
jgi:Leucine-rich repeat (LRR) protein